MKERIDINDILNSAGIGTLATVGVQMLSFYTGETDFVLLENLRELLYQHPYLTMMAGGLLGIASRVVNAQKSQRR